MRQIPDLMLCLQELNEGTVRRIRKTAEDPPRVSVIDTVALITGHSPTVCSHTLRRLRESQRLDQIGLASNSAGGGRWQPQSQMPGGSLRLS